MRRPSMRYGRIFLEQKRENSEHHSRIFSAFAHVEVAAKHFGWELGRLAEKVEKP